MSPVRYGDSLIGRQTVRRGLGAIVDALTQHVSELGEGRDKRALKAELSGIGDAIRRLESKILGPHGCVRSEIPA
jgi:hypothetical protein